MTAAYESKLRQLVSELFILRASGHVFDCQRNYPKWELKTNELKCLLKDGIGGVILYGGTINEVQERCRIFKQWAKKPILLCADIEEGVGQRFAGGMSFAPPMSISQIYEKNVTQAIEFAEQYGFFLGEQARKIGLNWFLGPVCDINSNPKNPVINLRAWGEDPITVSKLTSAFLHGISSTGVLTCAKHFPGHGDSDIDSHFELPVLSKNLKILQEFELVPFRRLIKEGIDSVMSAHLMFPDIDKNFPATLSKKILTNLLREKMHFDGLIVTDALVMNAISKRYGGTKTALLAFEAGADLIMMPEQPYEAIDSIVKGIISGQVSESRLYESLNRKRKAFEKFNNFIKEEDTNEDISKEIHKEYDGKFDSDKAILFSEKLIEKSLIVKNKDKFCIDEKIINLVVMENSIAGVSINDSFPALVIPKRLGFQSLIYNSMTISPWEDNSKQILDLEKLGKGKLFLQIFLRGNPFVSNSNSQKLWKASITQLQSLNVLMGVVVYGCPYFWNELLPVLAPVIPCAYTPCQTTDAQTKVLENLFDSLLKSSEISNSDLNNFTD